MTAANAQIRVCHGSGAKGGLAGVYCLAEGPDEDSAAIARDAGLTCVFISRTDAGYRAASYSPQGQPIRFCGHGALAAGWYVLQECEPAAEQVSFMNATHHWHARRSATPGADVRLIYAAPALAEISAPGFVAACIGSQPVAAAEAGAADDYLVVELSDAASVSEVEPDAAGISRHTERALIVTARSDDGTGCVFRYFAPQYGEPESNVTGSAAVQLGAWWGPRMSLAQFSARQLSGAGALMQLACHDGVVELAAQVGYG